MGHTEVFAVIGLIGALAILNRVYSQRHPEEPTHVCAHCQSAMLPLRAKRGSAAVEIALWLFLIIPGVIYTVWRQSSKDLACPKCGAHHPLPLSTPRAQALRAS